MLLGPQAKRNHLDVTFYVEEAGRVKFGLSAHAGRQSGDAVCIYAWKCFIIVVTSMYIVYDKCS